MFRGQFLHTIDQKGRVSLPARFREALESQGDTRLIMTPSLFDACLDVYPLKAWEEFERKISDLPSLDPAIVRFRRLYISPAVDVEIDRGGRIGINPDFRLKAELNKEALWAGMGRKAELWAKNRFDETMKMSSEEHAEFKKQVQELIRV